jgi:hypothetical protein
MTDDEKIAWMRARGVLHAEWTVGHDDHGDHIERLAKVMLGPPPQATITAIKPAEPKPEKGVVARMMAQHETMFAAARYKPPFKAPKSVEGDVPHAVSAKQRASTNGQAKSQKRAS